MKNIPQVPRIFITILMELVALGMIIPLSPFLSRAYGADDFQVGLLMSIYSAIQCVVSPFWGALSDRWGRKPVLLISLFFTSISYLWFAVAPDLSHLFYSRALAGFFGVNVSMSFSLISDATSSKKRSKSMALIGAAFGLGFIIGPTLGGLLGKLDSGEGFSLVALGAFASCFIGFLTALLTIKDYRPRSNFKFVDLFKKSSPSSNFLLKLYQAFKNPSLSKALLIFFILSLSLTLVEAPLFLLMKDQFNWSQSSSSLGFAYIGFILALTQGVFVRRWLPLWGENKINRWGFGLLIFGFFGLTFSQIEGVALAVTVMALGYALSYTCLTGAISLLTHKDHQGRMLGVHQSLSSVSRILGPALGGLMYRDLSHKAPFLAAASLAGLGLIFSFLFKKSIPQFGKKTSSYSDDGEFEAIDLFQLENIVKNQIPFSLYSLVQSSEKLEILFEGKNILSQAQSITPRELLNLSFNQPVILICEDGSLSRELALKISKKWTNVFYLKRGLLGNRK